MKKYKILPIFIAFIIATMFLLPQYSLFSNESAQAYTSCNCVIFRLDDIEDRGNADRPNVAIMQHFIEKNHKLSTEIVVNAFGNSGTSANVYNTVKQGYDSGLFELGIHGFDHARLSQLSAEQQKNDFEKAKNKLISLFDDPDLRLLAPPNNDFNSDTIKAMAENELDIFSSSYSSERNTPNPYKVSNSFETDNSIIQLSEVTVFDNDTDQYLKKRVYHVPFDISLFGMMPPQGTLSGQSLVDAVISRTATQIGNTGFAVITLHPSDIAPYNSATNSWSNSIDDVKFQTLKNIITALEAKDYDFSYLSDVTPAPFSEVVPGPSQASLLTLNTISNVGWGVDATVTGKLSDSATGAAIGGKAITFSGTGAANLPSVTTNPDGTFTAKGKAPSTVATGWQVSAQFAGDSSYSATTSSPRTYNTIAHTIATAVAVDRGSVPWGDRTIFTATMRDTTAGVPSGTMVTGKAITLDGAGVIGVSSSQTTDSSGKATFTGTAPTNVATGWTYQAHFAGDSLYKKSDSPIGTYSTVKHAVTLGLAVLKTGDPSGTTSTTVAPGENYKAQGVLNDPLTNTLLQGKTITFTADNPITITGKTTNLNGFYSGSQAAPTTAGTYNIQSHFAGDDLYSSRDSVTRTLTVSSSGVPGPSQASLLTLNTISNVGWGVDATVTGKLSDSATGAAIGGKAITFSGTGAANLPSVTTNPDGTFTAKGKAPSTVATGWQVSAQFAGDSSYSATTSSPRTYSTVKHAVTLGLAVLKTGDASGTTSTTVAPGENYKAQGTLLDQVTGTSLQGKTITFTADNPITITGKTTNLNGFYSGSQAAPTTAGTYNIQSHFAGDDLYSSRDSVTRTLTVSSPLSSSTADEGDPEAASDSAEPVSSPLSSSTADEEESTAEEPAASEDEDTAIDDEQQPTEEEEAEEEQPAEDNAQDEASGETDGSDE